MSRSVPTVQPGPSAEVRWRLRLLACVVALTGLAFVQSPGLLVPDTKLDLVLSPMEFLGRATHLWDAEGAFGQLQNQAYGYLWPMGPFFLLGWLLDVPGWVVQRLWLALVMATAFVGTARLSRALGVRSDVACLVAGFAFALSPRMLTTMGQISIEAWPSAVAPWVLLALVRGSERGSPRRAAALAALAVAMVGGVNAAATFAVVPLGVLWVLTRSPGPRRTALMVWWPLLTVVGTLWWLVPLFVMGAYSPPFLDYIEAAINTTAPTTLFDALRGTSNWVTYIDPTNRAGNDLLREFYLPIDSGVVLFLGCAGVLLRGPHRLFLALGVLTGLAMVTMGHTSGVAGWFAQDLFRLLDGPLAPLRNVHKFDPVLRLPLVLGIALVVDHVIEQRRAARASGRRDLEVFATRLTSRLIVGTAVLAVAGASVPALLGRITPSTGFQAVPDYWVQAADWLADDQRDGTALLVPGSAFGTYVWGEPRDEPMQSLAASPWAVRNAVPLAPPQHIRMLDAVERQLEQGRGSAALTTYLARAGITHLVVRNDLVRRGQPDPVIVHQAIASSPGLEPVAEFGPVVGGEAHLDGRRTKIVVNGGWHNEYPAIEVYAVRPQSVATGSAYSSTELPVVVGGAEDLLRLTDLGLLDDQPTRLATDVGEPPDAGTPLVLTDGLRWVERHFGRVRGGTSATLTTDDRPRMGSPTLDYLPEGAGEWLTRARTEGARSVTASSSMADANAFSLQPGQHPFAAVDRSEDTSWVSNFVPGVDAWWRLELDEPRPVEAVRITVGPQRQVVRVRTEGGVSEAVEVAAGASRTVRLDGGPTSWLRVEDASGRPGNLLELVEVEVPELSVVRTLQLPALPPGWRDPDVIALQALGDARTGCAEVDAAVRCVVGRDVAGEETLEMRRAFALTAAGDWEPRLWARPRPGPGLDVLVQSGLSIGISATSTGVPDQRAAAFAAIDGRTGTTWTAGMDSLNPELRLSWLGKRRVTGIDVTVAADTAARAPEELTVSWPGGRREVRLDASGTGRFPPVLTDSLTVRVEEAEPATSLDFGSNGSDLPIGISELGITGVPYEPVALSSIPKRLPCGSGPTLTVNGTSHRTSVTASPLELYAGARVPVELCGEPTVQLAAGDNAVDLTASDAFLPEAVVLSSAGVELTRAAPAQVQRPDAARARVTPAADDLDVVVLRQNFNRGWHAEQDAEALSPIVVDGWQQGWRAVDGAVVEARFAPDSAYRFGLAAGLLAAVLLAACAVVPDRRWRDAARPRVGGVRLPVGGAVVTATIGGGVLAGTTGAVLALVGSVVAWVLLRRAPETAVWVLPAAVLPAAAAYAVRPFAGAQSWAGLLEWPHYLVVVVSSFLVGGAAAGPGARAVPAWASRMKGRSTRR